MWYLFFQVWFLLLIAFILGWTLHWLFCCRKNKIIGASITSAVEGDSVEIEIEAEPGIKPPTLAFEPESPDDLKRIKGIGTVIEKTLNQLGVFHFTQLADWNQEHVQWVENYVAFPGRVKREDWVGQAKILKSGGTTKFAKRVDSGELSYETDSESA